MDTQLLEKRFSLIGARARFSRIFSSSPRVRMGIDIGTDTFGEFFDIKVAGDDDVSYEIVDLQPSLRHLLLMARRTESKEKFLCGHDERHWFVCAVPGKNVVNVVKAMENLQPNPIKWAVRNRLKRSKNRFDRKNEAFVRQGEWFFVPVEDLVVKENLIFKNEPISRGNGSKAHICQEVHRIAGTPVWVCEKYPNGVSNTQFENILGRNQKAQKWNWQRRYLNAAVFARGTVRHPDHKTIVLNGWHQVFMNTENEAPGMRHIVFLD